MGAPPPEIHTPPPPPNKVPPPPSPLRCAGTGGAAAQQSHPAVRELHLRAAGHCAGLWGGHGGGVGGAEGLGGPLTAPPSFCRLWGHGWAAQGECAAPACWDPPLPAPQTEIPPPISAPMPWSPPPLPPHALTPPQLCTSSATHGDILVQCCTPGSPPAMNKDPHTPGPPPTPCTGAPHAAAPLCTRGGGALGPSRAGNPMH